MRKRILLPSGASITHRDLRRITEALRDVPGVMPRVNGELILEVDYVICPRMTSVEYQKLVQAKRDIRKRAAEDLGVRVEFEGIASEIYDDATHEDVCGLPHGEES